MSVEDYVNEGTDKRARGLIGKLLASIQRSESFQSPTGPTVVYHKVHRPFLWYRKLELWEYRSNPHNKPFHVAFYYRKDGLIDTYRVGHRYDSNWLEGGYIYDVIIKLGRTEADAFTYIY